MQRESFRILVIDDDEIARDVVVSLLSKEGFLVHSAKDGLEGISALKREYFNLVITDLKMPGADGIEVLKSAVKLNPGAAVVILTAYGTLDNALEVMKLGAYDYITKPFKLQELLIVVENAINRAALIEENEELRKHLRETYRDLEAVKAVASKGPEVTLNMLERILRLKEMGIIDAVEVDVLKEKLMQGEADETGIGGR